MNYYKYDYKNLSFTECFTATQNLNGIVLLFCKLFRISIPLRGIIKYPKPVGHYVIEENQLPSLANESINQCRRELIESGFVSPRYFLVTDPVAVFTLSGCVMRHESGNAGAITIVASFNSTQPPTIRSYTAVLSLTTDNRILETTNQGLYFRSPPQIESLYIRGTTIEHLWIVHKKRLAEPHSQYLPVSNNDDVMKMYDRMEQASFDMCVERGIYKQLTEEELAAEKERLGIVYAEPAIEETMLESPYTEKVPIARPVVELVAEEDEADDTQDPQLLHEIDKILNHTSGAGGKAMLFIVSAILFIGAGSVFWSWQITLSLVPILLIHELGHYTAMKLLRYRNLRMLFIPMMGAAVTGRNFNVAGWKKVIVSLAGPVPGIILAFPFGIAGIYLETEWMVKTAFITIIINGINLLPFYPLDGGHVLHTTLFCRLFFLDIVFRLTALAAFAIGAVYTGDFILWFLAFIMLTALPSSIWTNRIVKKLSRTDLPLEDSNNSTIPQKAVTTIAGEIRASTTRPLNVRHMANNTLNIYERLTAKLPGPGQTLGLLALYGASILLAFVGLVVFASYQQP